MLPVILKVLADTSGAKFDGVLGDMDNLKVSSQKASVAVKQHVGGLASGQDPVSTLTSSLFSLTKGFGAIGIGVAAGAGVVALFAKESKEAKESADKLNTSIEGFQASVTNLDLSGAISQFQNLSKSIKESQSEKPGVIEGAVKGVVGFFGGNKEQLELARSNAQSAKGQAEFAVQTQLAQREMMTNLRRTNPMEAQRLELVEKQRAEFQKYVDLGFKQSTINALRKAQDQELFELGDKQAKEEAEQQAKKDELAKKAEADRLKAIETEAKEKEKAFMEELRQADALKKKREDLIQSGREAQGTLLDRLRGAAERFGLGKVTSQIDKEREAQQKQTDVAMLGRFGIDPTKMQGFKPNEMISQFAGTEGTLQREADTRLFDSVENMKGLVQNILQVVVDKLGVPILKSA